MAFPPSRASLRMQELLAAEGGKQEHRLPPDLVPGRAGHPLSPGCRQVDIGYAQYLNIAGRRELNTLTGLSSAILRDLEKQRAGAD